MTLLGEHGKHLMELCHFTHELNPLWEPRVLQQQIRSLAQDSINEAKKIDEASERFCYLNGRFFDDIQFCTLQKEHFDLNEILLPQVLISRQGPASLLMLLYCALMEECGLKIGIHRSKKKNLLRIHMNHRSYWVNFDKKCCRLDTGDIVQLVNENEDFSQGDGSSDQLMVRYLEIFKESARKAAKRQIETIVHSHLMKYQPFNLKHICERATVAFDVGNYQMVIDDIRNYFQYKQPKVNSDRLVRLYRQALRRKKQPNVTDPGNFN